MPNPPLDNRTAIDAYQARESQAFSLGVQAYLWGATFVAMEDYIRLTTSPDSDFVLCAPFNQWALAKNLSRPEEGDTDRPNVDTLYSTAWLDLSDEPMVLDFPDHGDRYFFFQVSNIRNDVLANLGTRTRGNGAGTYAIAGPDWDGELPPGMEKIAADFNYVYLFGRTLVRNEADLAEVRSLQEQYRLTPLSEYGKANPDRAKRSRSYPGKPLPAKSSLPPQLQFFEALGIAMQNLPPLPEERILVEQFQQIGLTAAQGFEWERLDAATIMGLVKAVPAGEQIIAVKEKELGITRNGWSYSLQTGNYGTDYLLRAAVIRRYIFIPTPAEAIYPITEIDDRGEQLHGSRRYRLKLAAAPPALGFWSLTVYDMSGCLVANPIGRCAIGDRTEGLEYGADGSLEISLQSEPPAGKESNWLPVPVEDFALVLRAFYPQPEILAGTYDVPPVERLD